MAEQYIRGTVVQVFKTDSNGQPTSHVERDRDGQLWHVKAGSDPTQVREDEVSSLATEESQRADDRDRDHR